MGTLAVHLLSCVFLSTLMATHLRMFLKLKWEAGPWRNVVVPKEMSRSEWNFRKGSYLTLTKDVDNFNSVFVQIKSRFLFFVETNWACEQVT